MKKDTRSKQVIKTQIKQNESDLKELILIINQSTVPEAIPYLDVAASEIAMSIKLDKLILKIVFGE